MPGSNNRFDSRLYAFVNAFVVVIVLLGVFIALNWRQMPGGVTEFLAYRITIRNLLWTGLFFLVSAGTFRAFGLSSLQRITPFWKDMVQMTKACAVASVFALLFLLTTVSPSFTARTVLFFLPAAIAACACGRIVSSALTNRLARTLRARRDLVIVGSGWRAERIYRQVCEPASTDTRVLGFVDSPNGHPMPDLIRKRMLGDLGDLEGILMRRPVDEVLIALPAKSRFAEIQTAIAVCERAGVEAKYLADVFDVSSASRTLESDGKAQVVSLKFVLDDYRLVVKRCIDIAGALVGLLLFGPLMIAIAVAIRLTSPGPALFVQERYGLKGRTFWVYKFRTMVSNADELLTACLIRTPDLKAEWQRDHKLRHDPRNYADRSILAPNQPG